MPKHKPIQELVGYTKKLRNIIKECDNTNYSRNQDYLRRRDKALILAVFLTGGYLEKVLELKKSNFVFDDKKRKGTEAFYIKKMGVARNRDKGNTFRKVPIYDNDPFVDLLKDWVNEIPDEDSYLFLSPNKVKGIVEHLKTRTAWKIISEITERAVDSSLTPMDLRILRMLYLIQEKEFTHLQVQRHFKMKVIPKFLREHKVKPRTINDAFREMKISARHFKLNNDWFSITCALQLQEVVVTLVATEKRIKLDRKTVERVLNKKLKSGYVPFGDKYDAFDKIIEEKYGIIMPQLTKTLRTVRTDVLHRGKTPQPEEVESIIVFTKGLLDKLKAIK